MDFLAGLESPIRWTVLVRNEMAKLDRLFQFKQKNNNKIKLWSFEEDSQLEQEASINGA